MILWNKNLGRTRGRLLLEVACVLSRPDTRSLDGAGCSVWLTHMADGGHWLSWAVRCVWFFQDGTQGTSTGDTALLQF